MGVDTNIIAAERALDTLNNEPIKGRPMRVMWYDLDQHETLPSLLSQVTLPSLGNIYIKNLDESIDQNMLYDSCSVFGNILSYKVSLQI